MDETPALTDVDRRVLLAELRGLVERASAIVETLENDLEGD